MTRVLVAEKIGASGIDLLKQHFDVDTAFDADGFDLEARIGDYDGLLIRSATKVTAELIDKAGNLKAIGRAGVGVDNVDVPAATKRGIIVANAPESNVVTAAERLGERLHLLRRPLEHVGRGAARHQPLHHEPRRGRQAPPGLHRVSHRSSHQTSTVAGANSATSGAWSEGFEPLRALRSTTTQRSRSASGALASSRSIRIPQCLWNAPAW